MGTVLFYDEQEKILCSNFLVSLILISSSQNNFDWYKRGTLPSLFPSASNMNDEKIADIIQASHAIMEDLVNVFHVLEGVKKKLALVK